MVQCSILRQHLFVRYQWVKVVSEIDDGINCFLTFGKFIVNFMVGCL